MRTVLAAELTAKLDKRLVLDAVREALILHANGGTQTPMPMHLEFPRHNGDCHIKAGSLLGASRFVVKIATGFYDNPASGLPVNDGMMIVFCSQTGKPIAQFLDGGLLTAWRTAAAVALAARAITPSDRPVIGIVGAGLQARLAVEWIQSTLPAAIFLVWARRQEAANLLAMECNAAVCSDLHDLLRRSDIVVTVTPSKDALVKADLCQPNVRIIGVGADDPEKHEVDASLFARATHILVDDIEQCIALGDFGKAIKAGVASRPAAFAIGRVLQHEASFHPIDSVVVDLTGLAAQDVAIANLYCRILSI